MLGNVPPSAAGRPFPSMSSSATNDVVVTTALPETVSDRVATTDPLVEGLVAVVGAVPGQPQDPFGDQVLEHFGGAAGNGEARRPAQPLGPAVGGGTVPLPGHGSRPHQVGA